MTRMRQFTLPAIAAFTLSCDGTPTAPTETPSIGSLEGTEALTHLSALLEARQSMLTNSELARQENEVLTRVRAYLQGDNGFAHARLSDDDPDIVVGNYMMSNVNHMTTWVTNNCCYGFEHRHSISFGGTTETATARTTGSESNAFTSYKSVSCYDGQQVTLSGDHKVIKDWGWDTEVGSIGSGTCTMAPE